MIIDIERFIIEGKRYWLELEAILDRLERNPEHRFDLKGVKRFHYLFQRASADLSRINTFSSEPETRRYLEALVSRAYCEIHEIRERPHKLAPIHWFLNTFPRTFRRHIKAFYLAFVVIFIGCSFGGFAVTLDPDAKDVLIPFPQLEVSPKDRVAKEENVDFDRLEESKATFSSYLMTNNTKVSIFAMALGITWGIGTIILLFYNGVILGAVVIDYILSGETAFLIGWLIPHGAVEIPAILIAGQAGFVLAGAIIGWGNPSTLKTRLRLVSGDLVTLIFGVGIMLVWAGFVESFFSQYHEPVIPYSVKIGFGLVELILLTIFLVKSGRDP